MSDYATLAEVHLRMPELGTGDDALITSLITSVSSYFDRFTGRAFAPEAATVRTFSGGELYSGGGIGHKKLFIRPALASAPTLVRIRNTANEAWRVVPAGDVKAMPEGRKTGDPILWLELIDTPTSTATDTTWPAADDAVEITGTWNQTAVPEDIHEACLQTVVNLYRSRGSAGLDEVANSAMYMPTIPKAIPAFAYQVLRSYKKLVYA